MNFRLLHALYLLGNKFEKLLSSICVHMGIKDDRDASGSIGKKLNSIVYNALWGWRHDFGSQSIQANVELATVLRVLGLGVIVSIFCQYCYFGTP